MITENSVFTVTVPDWINKVVIGTVKTEYYVKGDKLPEVYKDCKTKRVSNKTYYVDDKNRKLIKNPDKQGNKEYWNVNGQSFYSNNMTWRNRSTIVNFYHKYFLEYVVDQLKEPFPTFLAYKLDMELTIYEKYSRHTPDISNMWVLAKMMEDTVVKAGILRDDSPQFRMRTSFGYQLVDSVEDRKLVLEFKYNKY